MLKYLHVKNLALIRETEVEFHDGLNILSGETGAGKSLIIGSVNLALGKRADSSIISKGAEYALVELVFEIKDEAALEALAALDIFPEDGQIIISRKIYEGRSVCKINGETVNTSTAKSCAEYLIDIHGQHDHQSLLYSKNHLVLLDKYASDEIGNKLEAVASKYREYSDIKKKLNAESVDDKEKNRDISILEHEVSEIEGAKLQIGEDEELEQKYQLMGNSKKIMESLGMVYQIVSGNNDDGVASFVGKAVKELSDVVSYDKGLAELYDELSTIEGTLNDFSRGVSGYMDDFSFDAAEYNEVEVRLNLINRMKERYGNTIEEILDYADKAAQKLEKYSDYDAYIEKLNSDFAKAGGELTLLCNELSDIRVKAAKEFDDKIMQMLSDLNFDKPVFKTKIDKKADFTSKGNDDISFLISLNPGEELKPLSDVASGGELSRIMLALKCVCADFGIETMIFDEIDSGISGRTADMVAKKLSELGNSRQIISITHLPQIAAYADSHYLIEKTVADNVTSTQIIELKTEDERTLELSRMLGGEKITDAVKENALELIRSAHS